MNGSSDEEKTIADELDQIFQRPFTPRHISKLQIDNEDQRRYVAETLYSFYGYMTLPEKAPELIRPAIVRPGGIWMTGAGPHYDDFPITEIKRSLLYCDQLAVDILAITTRCRLLARYPVGRPIPEMVDMDALSMRDIERRLLQLSEMNELIRHRYILPFSSASLREPEHHQNRYDPLFASVPDAIEHVEVMKRTAAELSQVYKREIVERPFYSAFFAAAPTVNPDLVTFDDLLTLRRDEEIFSQWRDLVRSIISDLVAHRGDFTDFAGEFSQVTHDRYLDWKNRLDVQMTRRPALKALFSGAMDIGIQIAGILLSSWASSLIFGSIMVPPNAGPQIVKAFIGIHGSLSRRHERAALEQALLAIGARQ